MSQGMGLVAGGMTVPVAKVVEAFGVDHGFPVRNGEVQWSEIVPELERLRREALAAG